MIQLHVSDRDESPPTEGMSIDDAVLAFIPMSLLTAIVAALAFPLSVGTALALGSLPATGTIGYALFYNPPAAVAGQQR